MTPYQISKNIILKNKIVVLTGEFDIPRLEYIKNLREQGARVETQLTKDTDYLIEGRYSGSKVLKASALGIKILFDYKGGLHETGC